MNSTTFEHLEVANEITRSRISTQNEGSRLHPIINKETKPMPPTEEGLFSYNDPTFNDEDNRLSTIPYAQ